MGAWLQVTSSVADPLVRSRAAPRRRAEDLVQRRRVCDQTCHRREQAAEQSEHAALRRHVELVNLIVQDNP